MSVYTVLEAHDFHAILAQYNVGQLVSFQGIMAGVENTNYKVRVKKNGEETDYFLTVFEMLENRELSFFLPYLNHLHGEGCSLAWPIPRIEGELSMKVKNKPAALFNCLQGGHPEPLTTHHAREIGKALAHIHVAGQGFKQTKDNARGYYWIQQQIQKRALKIGDDDYALMNDQFRALREQHATWGELPRGMIHGDLFPDNALFDDQGHLTGVIDFYCACNDILAYDLAITIMAWCRQPDATINVDMENALAEGYESIRPLSKAEVSAMPALLCLAALRFWISRLVTLEQQADAEMTNEIDPEEMKRLLKTLAI